MTNNKYDSRDKRFSDKSFVVGVFFQEWKLPLFLQTK
jgi:hypothetical protein